MSSRRKCEKRHIGFLTSIYREGIGQTVCSFALQILLTRTSPLYSAKNSACAVVAAVHSLLPRWVTTRRTQIEHIESASLPKSGHEEDVPGWPLRAKSSHWRAGWAGLCTRLITNQVVRSRLHGAGKSDGLSHTSPRSA